MEYILIFIAAVFVNNVVLAQFLGICPFLGVSKKVSTAIGMTGALTFVMILATLVTFIIQKSILDPFGIGFMQTITFILVIAALVQMVEIILKKVSPALYQALGVFLPLITTNCAVLGVAIMVRLQSVAVSGICCFYSHRIRIGTDHLCRYPRTPRTGGYSPRHERILYRSYNSRSACHGIHGILRNRIVVRTNHIKHLTESAESVRCFFNVSRIERYVSKSPINFIFLQAN